MEIRRLAEQVLFGSTLADKLVRPSVLTDAAPGQGIEVPSFPGRPPGLAPSRRRRQRFPGVSELDRRGARGHVLHHFANHELLALELMALALLRFPKAPAAFRRAVAQTLFEEQNHLELYRGRMAECGVELGEVPANAWFWDALSGMQTPLDYVAGLSLTLEQANLDFARFYSKAFDQAGDPGTSEVLDRIYEDEIGHVKLGRIWFARWTEGDEWSEHCRALSLPLTPSRAKGKDFDIEGRRRAGFSEAYIRSLQLYTHSKGRVPALHRLNLAVELERAGRTPPKAVLQVQTDLECLPMFICAGDDAVQVSKLPRTAFLEGLNRAGFAIPQFVSEVGEQRFSATRWWADPATPTEVFAKSWAAGLATDLHRDPVLAPWIDEAPVGVLCSSMQAVEAQRASLGGEVVCKAPLGTAGRSMLRWRPGEGTPKGLAKLLEWQGGVVVEPWLDRVMDLSVQLRVEDDETRVDGVTRFLTDRRGQYLGVVLGRLTDGASEEMRRWLMAGEGVLGVMTQVAEVVGDALREAGHRGPAGVDAFVHRRDGRLFLRPLVEVNPRCTMARVALGLRRRVSARRRAVWLQLPTAKVDFEEAFELSDGLLDEGALFTTDPVGARFTTALFVGRTLGELADRYSLVGAAMSAGDVVLGSR